MVSAADVAVAVIDLEDVGTVGAHLLALEDTTPHSNARYVLSGPEDVTGRDLVKIVEQYAGVKVGKAEFEDTSFLSGLTKSGLYPEKAMPSFLTSVKDFLCSMKDILRPTGFVVLAVPATSSWKVETGILPNTGKRVSLSASDGSCVWAT